MTPTPADAAWEALYVSILHAEGDGQSIERRMKRHRPLIEAALTQPPVLLSLSINEQTVTHPAEPTLDPCPYCEPEHVWPCPTIPRCDEPGCERMQTCGWPTRPGGTGPNGGYRRTCGLHYREYARLATPSHE